MGGEFTNLKTDRIGVWDLEDSFVFVFQDLWSSRTIRVVIVTVLEAEITKDRRETFQMKAQFTEL